MQLFPHNAPFISRKWIQGLSASNEKENKNKGLFRIVAKVEPSLKIFSKRFLEGRWAHFFS
jgi:hypothetical protein